MPVITSFCPDSQKLRQVLDDSLETQELEKIEAHLCVCECCQQKLESLATNNSLILQSALHADQDRPPAQSAYWPTMQKVHQELSPSLTVTSDNIESKASGVSDNTPIPSTNDTNLDFLDPPKFSEYLGEIDRFGIEQIVGRGGMGIVFRALDRCLQRTVALKVLDPQLAKNEIANERFCREARAAASIMHENVITIHYVDRNEEKDLFFIIMQYVEGQSLQDRIDKEGQLPVRDILHIGSKIAYGLAAAHKRGVIHRDIKPANVLLEQETHRVLLTDFGLARVTEDVRLTQSGFVAGTPLYMSPEQAKGEDLDERSDLFSLGGVLYSMCTGTPPFQGSSPFVVLQNVTQHAPKPIHRLNPNIPEDLIAIIERLLEKDPQRRIQSAAELGDLLSVLLGKLPTDPSESKQSRKSRVLPRLKRSWWGRNSSWLAALSWGMIGLLVVTELSQWTTWTKIGQRGMNPTAAVSNGSIAEEATPEPPRPPFKGNGGPVWGVAFSSNGSFAAMGLDDGSIKIWNVDTNQIIRTVSAHTGPVWCLKYSPDGHYLASASDSGVVKLWDAFTYREVATLPVKDSIRTLEFSPDSRFLVSGARNGIIQVWDVETHQAITKPEGHTHIVMGLAYSPDGKKIASASGDKLIKIWDASNGNELLKLEGHKGGVYAIAYYPSGKYLASGSWDRTIRLWDSSNGELLHTFEGHKEDVWSIAFSLDGKYLISGSEDRTVRIWDMESRKQVQQYRGHTGTIYSVAINSDGSQIASGSRDGTMILWPVDIKK